MEGLMIPILFYAACAAGAVGIILAIPRRGPNPQILGGLLAAAALGGIFLSISLGKGGFLPNYHYYIFSAIALASAIRVITHPKPVYAALYFILTILASSGLYVILGAEFMAFALIIVYAGAILITYLFVIMLATQAPSEEDVDALAEYDRFGHEPVAATAAGFTLVAILTTLMARGLPATQPALNGPNSDQALMTLLPKKVESSLRRAGLLESDESIVSMEQSGDIIVAIGSGGATRTITRAQWPADLKVENIEGVAFELLEGKPGAIEIAGIILLMAMLGAVVLARKKVELDDAAKAAAHFLVEPKAVGFHRHAQPGSAATGGRA